MCRLISCTQTITWKQLAVEIKKQFPDYPVTPAQDDEKVIYKVDNHLLTVSSINSDFVASVENFFASKIQNLSCVMRVSERCIYKDNTYWCYP